jgi:restriction system protein
MPIFGGNASHHSARLHHQPPLKHVVSKAVMSVAWGSGDDPAHKIVIVVGASGPEALLRGKLFVPGDTTADGVVIAASLVPWRVLDRAQKEDPKFWEHFDPYMFEELIGTIFKEEGYEYTIITPKSGDRGRDIIAVRGDWKFKVFGQAKRYKATNLVTAEEVRAFCHVIDDDRSVSKGIITTTSAFAPGVPSEFAERIPTRLELEDGDALRQRIEKLAARASSPPTA